MELFLFKDLLIIFCFSIVVLLVGHRFNLPPVVGFLLTGVLAGPHGLALVGKTEDVEILAQVGIILLLFGIGMEFSIKKLVQIKRLFLLGGTLQVGLTILVSFCIGMALGRSWNESIFLGCLLCMSSTAIVLELLEKKGETQSPHGRLSISILIFQDMIAIPMILLTPLLISDSSNSQPFDFSLIWLLAKGLVILFVVFISAQHFVPKLLLAVARTRNKELFLLTVLSLCFGVAWLTSSLGLSLTIGAFLAGLLLSESEYSNEAISHIFPFQALFISFFFVSVGMLLNLDFVFHQPGTILALVLLVICLKAVAATLTAIILRMPIRTAVLVGITLSQIGEFAFVLAKTGFSLGLVNDDFYQLFLSVSLLSLAISPFLINWAPIFANWIASLPLPEKLRTGIEEQGKNADNSLQNHIIIIGFGISGRNLARSSKLANIPYIILEMNPDTVKEQRLKGEPIHFGDATHLSVLEHLKIHDAQTVAILINDPLAARQVVKIAREANPTVYIIVRTRYVQEISLMKNLGADEAIPDEFGTSVEIFTRVLRQYHVPDDEINAFIDDIRADGYDVLRNQSQPLTKLSELKLNLSNVEIASFRLQESSSLVGKLLSESQLRHEYGMTVLLIRRGSNTIANPPHDMRLVANDILVVVGDKVCFKQAGSIFGNAAVMPT
jgi:CPA2 family monovalent cation:H+ antiporter-2